MATIAMKKADTEAVEDNQKDTKGTAIVNWQDEMARQAEVAAKMEANAGGGQFFSLKSGQLSWGGNPLPDNQMAVVILDHIMENVYYDSDYDADNPQGPICFAFGREEKEMVPHQVVFENDTAQSPQCHTCRWNEWASAPRGKGKACKNGRRLALIGAGQWSKQGQFQPIEDEDHWSETGIGYLKVPVTSVNGYGSFVKQVAGVLKRPPFGIITRVKVVPDAKSQFKVQFEPMMALPDEVMPMIMKRHQEARSAIEFPYQVADRAEEQEAPAKGATKAKAAAKPAARRKY